MQSSAVDSISYQWQRQANHFKMNMKRTNENILWLVIQLLENAFTIFSIHLVFLYRSNVRSSIRFPSSIWPDAILRRKDRVGGYARSSFRMERVLWQFNRICRIAKKSTQSGIFPLSYQKIQHQQSSFQFKNTYYFHLECWRAIEKKFFFDWNCVRTRVRLLLLYISLQ